MIRRLILAAALMALGACDRPAEMPNVAEVNDSQAQVPGEPADNAIDAAEPARTAGREPIGYTSLRPADCRMIEQNAEEAGYSRHRCPGLAGYALETSESDLRQSLVVIAPGGKETELDLSGQVARGAFNALGPAAEWRGKDARAPGALIVRRQTGPVRGRYRPHDLADRPAANGPLPADFPPG